MSTNFTSLERNIPIITAVGKFPVFQKQISFFFVEQN
jgi:hypothetical protein